MAQNVQNWKVTHASFSNDTFQADIGAFYRANKILLNCHPDFEFPFPDFEFEFPPQSGVATCPCCKELVAYGNPESSVLEDHYGTCIKERQKRQYLENRGKAKKNDPQVRKAFPT